MPKCPSRKRGWLTWTKAMMVATAEGKESPQAYRCPACGHWHITRQPQRIKQA